MTGGSGTYMALRNYPLLTIIFPECYESRQLNTFFFQTGHLPQLQTGDGRFGYGRQQEDGQGGECGGADSGASG